MNQKLQKRREEALRRLAVYQQLFETPQGKEVLEDLRRTFEEPDIDKPEPHKTFVRVGEVNVIRYIDRVLNYDVQKLEPTGE